MKKIDLLKLLSVPGVGQHRIRMLIGHFHNPENVMKARVEALRQVEGIDAKIAYAIRNQIDTKFAEQQLALMDKHNVNLVSFWDANYPKRLKSIYDPPALLYVKGQLTKTQKLSIAVVGMRFKMAVKPGRFLAVVWM